MKIVANIMGLVLNLIWVYGFQVYLLFQLVFIFYVQSLFDLSIIFYNQIGGTVIITYCACHLLRVIFRVCDITVFRPSNVF